MKASSAARGVGALVAFAFGGAALGVGSAAADDAPPPCDAFEVEYLLAANLKLSETPMGEGDGVYSIGPGKVVLRFENKNGQPGGNVQMLQYAMREYFVIKSKTLFWTTSVTTDTNTAATPNACSIAAQGALDSSRTVKWSTPVAGYHTDGTLTCEGSMCGKFGAPPPGQSPFHIPPGPVAFNPFVFAADMKTFTMASAHVSKTDMPKQSGEVSLAGRETKRTCVAVAPCK